MNVDKHKAVEKLKSLLGEEGTVSSANGYHQWIEEIKTVLSYVFPHDHRNHKKFDNISTVPWAAIIEASEDEQRENQRRYEQCCISHINEVRNYLEQIIAEIEDLLTDETPAGKSKPSIFRGFIESISSGVTKGTLDHLDKR